MGKKILKWFCVKACNINFSNSYLILSLLAAFLPITSLAQSGDGVSLVLEEMVVTAQRREQPLQDVPISVSVFSAEALEQAGASDLIYLNETVPNATLERSRATNSTITAFIRGVGQQDPVVGYEQGVGIYIDDVYLNRPQGAVLDIYDVERIEVLRGPQGTLYGRNTIGGAVKYVTRRLADAPELTLRGAFGTYAQTDGMVSFGLPINETVRIGGAVARLHRNGFGKNITLDEENYDKDQWVARGAVELYPADTVFVRLSGDWAQDDSNPRHGHRLLDSQFNRDEDGQPLYRVLDDVFDSRAGTRPPPRPQIRSWGLALLTEWQPDERWTVKNILGYRDNDWGQLLDFDSLPVVDLDVPYIGKDDQFSEEFQVLYDGNHLHALAGFYYLDATAANEFDVLLYQTVANLNAYTFGEVTTKTWSVFGDVTINLGDWLGWASNFHALELSVGGRYTEDERQAQVQRRTLLGNSAAFGNASETTLATTSRFNGSKTFSDFSPRAALSFKPNADNTVYFSFSQGFKGGGFDPRGQTSAAPDLNNDGMVSAAEVFEFMSFDPETITTYELGWKTAALGGRVNSSFAVFYSDYEDVQIPGSIGVDTDSDGIADNFTGVVNNAGKARLWGIETEGNAILASAALVPGDSVTARWALGWINAEFREFLTAVTTNGATAIQNIADQRNVQNTPEWTFSLNLDYSRPLQLAGHAGELSLLPSFAFRSASSQFEFASPIDQGSYSLINASLVWSSDDGRYQLGIHGRNLGNKEYIVAGYDFVTNAPRLGQDGTLTAFYGDPRTITGAVQIKF